MSAPVIHPRRTARWGISGGPIAHRRGLLLGPGAWPLRRRPLLVGLVLAAAVLLLLLGGLAVGQVPLSFGEILDALMGQGPRVNGLIVNTRLPRVLAGLGAGMALGAAGAITQSMTRNPLASPDILGITSGAGFGAAVIFVFPGTFGVLVGLGIPLTAFLFGLGTAAAIVLLGRRGGIHGMRLILAGIALGSLLDAGISFALLKADLFEASQVTRWLVGSLSAATYQDDAILLITVAVCLLITTVGSRDLAMLRMDGDSARALGTPMIKAQLVHLVVAVLMVSIACAFCGPIGFVALVAPQLALQMMRTAGPPVLGGGLVGAILLLASDLAVRVLPGGLPAGAITALIGSPYLLYLLHTNSRRTSA